MTTAQITLHDITAELRAVQTQLLENGGEVTPEIETQLRAWTGAVEFKAHHISLGVEELDAAEAACDLVIERWQREREIIQNVRKAWKDYLLSNLQAGNIHKVEYQGRPVCTVARNGRPQIKPTVSLEVLAASCPALVRMTYAFDGETAYEMWKKDQLPADLVSVEIGEHLRFSRKRDKAEMLPAGAV